MKKFGLWLTDRQKCILLIFGFSLYPNLKWPLSKILYWISRVLVNFYYVTNIFDLHIFDNETTAFLFFFLIHFVSLVFLNERNITTSPSMIHSKFTVVHYAHLNSSSKNKSFLNYGPLNMLFCFLRFLICVYFNEAFVKKFMK